MAYSLQVLDYGHAFVYRTYHIVSWRFDVYNYSVGEIGRQRVKVPLAAAISPSVLSLTYPPNPCTHECERQNKSKIEIDRAGGRGFKFRPDQHSGFLNN